MTIKQKHHLGQQSRAISSYNVYGTKKNTLSGDQTVDLKWLMKDLLEKQDRTPKTIVYCSDHKSQYGNYESFISKLRHCC